MDPQLSKLDPKVAETFQRVMNTPVPPVKPLVQTPPSGMPNVAAPEPTTNPTPPPVTTAPIQPQPEMSTPQPNEPQKVVVIPPQQAQAENTNSQVFSSKKKGGKVSPVILGLGIVIFLAVYTLIWVKVFNLSLPFLP